MKVLGHGNGDPKVERVAGVAVVVYDDVAGDRTLGNLYGCAGGPAKRDGSGGIADGRIGAPVGRTEMRAMKLHLSPGHGCRRRDAVQMRRVGVRRFVLQQ